MANRVILNGFFGYKQSFFVSDPTITTGWAEGQLFKVDEIGTSGTGTLKGAVTGYGPFVALNATSGAAIAGIALEGSDEATTAVSGMQHPSGSKVTLLHGHSTFFVAYDGTATSSTTRQAGTICYQSHVESASLMDLLYAGADGKFSTSVVTSTFAAGSQPQAIGYLSQIPATGNDWTIGVVLFG